MIRVFFIIKPIKVYFDKNNKRDTLSGLVLNFNKIIMRNMKKICVALFVLAILVPSVALGATFKAGEEVSITKGNDVSDNLYVAGGNVSLSSVVSGDLYTAGGNILISETVSEDVLVLGGAVTILGDVVGDLRVVGGNVLIAGNVSGEVIAIGGTVTIPSGVLISGDVVSLGGVVSIEGDVLGDVKIFGGVASINGNVKGDVSVKVDEKFSIGSGAHIEGAVIYQSQTTEALSVDEAAIVVGEITYKEGWTKRGNADGETILGIISAFVFMKVVTLILLALVLVGLFKRFSHGVVVNVVQSPLRMLGKGFVTLVVTPVLALLLCVTLLGAPFAVIIMFSFGILLVLSALYASVVVGAWVSKVLKKSDELIITWKNIVGGVLLLLMISFIPLIGFIVGVCVFLLTLGSLADIVQKKLWSNR